MAKWNRKKSKRKRWIRNHLIEKNGNICSLCTKPFTTMKDVTLDHVIPVSKGGDDEVENLQLAHFHCNQTKDDMTPEEFEEFNL